MTINKAVPAQWAVRVLLGKIGEAIDKAELGTPASHLSGKKLKARLLEEFDSKCVYCESSIAEDYEADHIVPTNRMHGGVHSIANLVASCRKCNLDKGGKTLEEFLKASPQLDANAVKQRISARNSKLPATPNIDHLMKITQNLHAQVSSLVEETYLDAIATLNLKTPTSIPKNASGQGSEIDYSAVSIEFPLDSLVESSKDDLLGIVATYSMQGAKGKRTAYVGVKDIATGKVMHRSPATLKLIRKANPEE
jgi:5-methylcytosine-specific restriction endonuclease McrA